MSPPPPPAAPAARRHWSSVLLPVVAVLFVLALVVVGHLGRAQRGGHALAARPRARADHAGRARLVVGRRGWRSTRCAGRGWRTQPSLQIDGLELQQPSWRLLPHSGAWLSLTLPSLKARRVVWHSPRESGPAGPPLNQLRLPFALDVEALEVAELQLDDQPPWHDVRARIALGQAEGAEHRIGDLSLHNDRVRIRADVRSAALRRCRWRCSCEASALSGTPWQAQVNARRTAGRLHAARHVARRRARRACAVARRAGAHPAVPGLAAGAAAVVDARARPGHAQQRGAAHAHRCAGRRAKRRPRQAGARRGRAAQPRAGAARRQPRAGARTARSSSAPRRTSSIASTSRVSRRCWPTNAPPPAASAASGEWNATDLRLQLQLSGVEPARVHRKPARCARAAR